MEGHEISRARRNPVYLDQSPISFPNRLYIIIRTVFIETANYARQEGSISIDDVVKFLTNSSLLRPQENVHRPQAARLLVFAFLGWQTMLYAPSFGTCPPQQLALGDVLDGYTGQAYTVRKQDQASTRHRLPDFLLRFGVMLPGENTCFTEDREERQAFENLVIVNPQEFNASLLQSVARVRIQWVDVLAPHLEYDQATNTLFLFRYSSFCAANLPSSEEKDLKGVIHSCACRDGSLECWASRSDVTRFLHEVVLSYRLLFGQTQAARQLFRSMAPFAGTPVEGHDPLLPMLCGGKSFDCSALAQDRELYRLSRDFPILRSRIAVLHQHLSSMKPRGWRELWRDRRDTAQWYTFWAVMVIGGCGIVLTLVQVGLQAAQLARS
ncbi:MAG: hypothetical protein M1816_004493 [Peltula sp. TS41687]|nr:MAG: hypothetical protein M1816_004493 [Peltula sp. TS41687]